MRRRCSLGGYRGAKFRLMQRVDGQAKAVVGSTLGCYLIAVREIVTHESPAGVLDQGGPEL